MRNSASQKLWTVGLSLSNYSWSVTGILSMIFFVCLGENWATGNYPCMEAADTCPEIFPWDRNTATHGFFVKVLCRQWSLKQTDLKLNMYFTVLLQIKLCWREALKKESNPPFSIICMSYSLSLNLLGVQTVLSFEVQCFLILLQLYFRQVKSLM